jgi:hypothetical protein
MYWDCRHGSLNLYTHSAVLSLSLSLSLSVCVSRSVCVCIVGRSTRRDGFRLNGRMKSVHGETGLGIDSVSRQKYINYLTADIESTPPPQIQTHTHTHTHPHKRIPTQVHIHTYRHTHAHTHLHCSALSSTTCTVFPPWYFCILLTEKKIPH